jgi:hypothetical protein
MRAVLYGSRSIHPACVLGEDRAHRIESFLWPPAPTLNQRGQTWHAACKGGPHLRFSGCQFSASVTQWLPRFRAGLISFPAPVGRATRLNTYRLSRWGKSIDAWILLLPPPGAGEGGVRGNRQINEGLLWSEKIFWSDPVLCFGVLRRISWNQEKDPLPPTLPRAGGREEPRKWYETHIHSFTPSIAWLISPEAVGVAPDPPNP